jgi:ATP-dependent Lhr-like helicase
MDARTADIKKSLPRTWPVFFAPFGRLLPIQIEVIPRMMKGQNLVICAPAAAGKTEGVVAPLFERILEKGLPEHGLRLLYVVPTRALANDIYKRLKDAARDLGVSLAVRTGDRRLLKIKKPEHVLITTPESFDSLLCRYGRLWDHLEAVILDEIHLVDNTYRGDQLRVLLRRLREQTGGRALQYAALSATLSDPSAIGNRYFDAAHVVSAGEPRRLNLNVFDNWEAVIRFLKDRKRLKAIIFCNRRRDVEDLNRILSALWPPDRIVVHHGSLSASIRREAEAALHQWDWGLCICTMTLEIGIDIGDFSAVVLAQPPLSLYAFQQRIGRACRREEAIEVIGYAASPEDEDIYREFVRMTEGAVRLEDTYQPDPAVAVQQIFSLAFARPAGITDRELKDLLSPVAPPATVREILNYLADLGWLRRSGRGWQAAQKLMDMGIRGLIHSNIPDEKEWTLVDADSGKAIGDYPMAGAGEGDTVILGGLCWTIKKISGKKIFARRSRGGLKISAFARRGSHSAFYRYLPEDLR